MRRSQACKGYAKILSMGTAFCSIININTVPKVQSLITVLRMDLKQWVLCASWPFSGLESVKWQH